MINPNDDGTNGSNDLGDAGKELLAKFRKQNQELERQVKELTSQLSTQKTEYEGFKDKYETDTLALKTEAQKFKNYKGFHTSATEKINPTYLELAWNSLGSELQSSDDGLMVGDRPLDDALDDFVGKYPDIAIKSKGSQQSTSSDSRTGTDVEKVSAAGFINDLDSIIEGKKQLSD